MFLISDLPPQMPMAEVRLYCSVEAAVHYAIPADLVYAVAVTEGGRPGISVRNSNGTFDLGSMQFNTAYLKTLKKEGIEPEHVQKSGCYPFHLAAWRIKGHLEEKTSDDPLTRVAYYHSRTPRYNVIYRGKLISALSGFDRDLAERFFQLIMERLRSLFRQHSEPHQTEPYRPNQNLFAAAN